MKTNNMQKKNKKSKGSVVAYALIIVTIVSLILVSAVKIIVSQIQYGFYLTSKNEAFQIAEAGIQYYHWYLAHQTDGKNSQDISEFWATGNPIGVSEPYFYEYKDKNENVIGEFKLEVAPPETGSSVAMVVSSGWTSKYPNVISKIKVRFRRSSWSDYAVLINDPSFFDSKWNINGKVMSNNGLHFDGVAQNIAYAGVTSYTVPAGDPVSPGANKPGVWTKWPSEINTDVSPNSSVFLSGKRFPIAKKDFSGFSLNLGFIQEYAKEKGASNNCTTNGGARCYFSLKYNSQNFGNHIILQDDGKFKVYNIQQLQKNNNIKKENYVGTYNIPEGGVIFVESDVWLEGKIDGQKFTIVAANIDQDINPGRNANIYVGMEKIEYEDKDGSSILGVISQNNIEIIRDSIDNFEFDGAILAQSGAINKPDYNLHTCGQGSSEQHNDIIFYGSLASNRNITFTSTKTCNGGEKFGYMQKRVVYDNNLIYSPPPFFPADSYYLVDLWEEL